MLADWQPFGAHVDWGNVPTWTGSLLTAGSVFLLYRVFLRDRKAVERNQAEKLTCLYQATTIGAHAQVRQHTIWSVTLHNASKSPMYDIRLAVRPVDIHMVDLSRAEWANLDKERRIARQFGESKPVSVDELGDPVGQVAYLDVKMFFEDVDKDVREQRASWLASGVSTSLEVKTYLPEVFNTPYVHFTDSSNRKWRRNLKTNDLNRSERRTGIRGVLDLGKP